MKLYQRYIDSEPKELFDFLNDFPHFTIDRALFDALTDRFGLCVDRYLIALADSYLSDFDLSDFDGVTDWIESFSLFTETGKKEELCEYFDGLSKYERQASIDEWGLECGIYDIEKLADEAWAIDEVNGQFCHFSYLVDGEYEEFYLHEFDYPTKHRPKR